jgi:ABC-type taurine transport system substrate-binding protein
VAIFGGPKWLEKQAIEEMFVIYNRALIEKNHRLLGEQLAVPFIVVESHATG